jgi:hypothetical protein
MKSFLLRAAVPLCLALGAIAPARAADPADANTPVPDQVAFADLAHGHWVCISFFNGAQRTDRRIPAQDGWAAVSGTSTEEKYKVFSQADDHLAVRVRRVTSQAMLDFVLPVWVKEPGPANRVKLNDGSMAVAYLIMKPAQ